MSDFLKYLEESSAIVSSWPEWKQNGSDVTKFLENKDE